MCIRDRGLPVDDDSDPLSQAEDEDEDDASSRRVVDIDITVEAPAQPASRVVRMCPSLWPDAREATVYFPYPQKDVNLERSGPLPVAADLGARRLAYRCTWERNCIKNAFSLAGFRRVKDGTELRALKGVRGEASPDGSGSGLADFVGGLLGLAPTGAAGGKKKGKKALDAHVTKLPWCASWTKHPGAEVYATQRRHQRVKRKAPKKVLKDFSVSEPPPTNDVEDKLRMENETLKEELHQLTQRFDRFQGEQDYQFSQVQEAHATQQAQWAAALERLQSEHKREIERIWNERLQVYQAQRAIEE